MSLSSRCCTDYLVQLSSVRSAAKRRLPKGMGGVYGASYLDCAGQTRPEIKGLSRPLIGVPMG